jgi:hypothetical protein
MESGMEHHKIFLKSLNRWDFIEYLTELIKKQTSGRLALLIDNLALHKTLEVRHFCRVNDIELIFNVPYASALQVSIQDSGVGRQLKTYIYNILYFIAHRVYLQQN